VSGAGVHSALNDAARVRRVTPGWLKGCCGAMGVVPEACVVLSTQSSTISAAKDAGMAAGAVVSMVNAGGSFPSADFKFDGLGPGGGATWAKLQSLQAGRSG